MNRQLTHRIANELAPGAHLVRNQPHPSERGSAWGGLSPTNKPNYASLGNSRNIIARMNANYHMIRRSISC